MGIISAACKWQRKGESSYASGTIPPDDKNEHAWLRTSVSIPWSNARIRFLSSRYFSFPSFLRWGKNVGTELLRIGKRPTRAQVCVIESDESRSFLSNGVCLKLCLFIPFIPSSFENFFFFFHRFKFILDTCLRLEISKFGFKNLFMFIWNLIWHYTMKKKMVL